MTGSQTVVASTNGSPTVEQSAAKLAGTTISEDQSWATFLKYYRRLHTEAWKKIMQPNAGLKLPDDEVLMTSYPKCGTNWMLQILHQIRTGGDESFNSIFDCFRPCMGEEFNKKVLEKIVELQGLIDKYNLPPVEEQMNGFKKYHPIIGFAHITADDTSKMGTGKRIVVIRNPVDSFVSLYKFLPNFCNIDESKMSMEDYYFGLHNCLMKPAYFEYVRGWVQEAERNDKVLLVMFEDMKKDLSGVIDRLASFLDVNLDAEHKAKVLQMSSFKHMSENQHKYNPPFIGEVMRKLFAEEGEEIVKHVGFIRQGGTNYEVPQKIKDHMQLMWQQIVEPATGCKDYEELYRKKTFFK